MRVRNLGLLAFFMCASAAGIVDARTLHVGDKVFNLSQTQYTTPSLACKINNETWYAPMTKIPLTDTLHLRYNNTTYSVCEPFTDTTNYTYDNDGRLIGADGNLYLQSTGTQYIDTDFTPSFNSYMEINFKKISSTADVATVSEYLTDRGQTYSFGIMARSTVNTTAFVVYNGENKTGVYWRIEKNRITGNGTAKYSLILNKQNATIAGLTHTFPSNQYSLTRNLFLFGWNNVNAQTPLSTIGTLKIYSCILKDNDVLARHFVPVPACMRIGNFIVPENGMWDIVEQKFYDNSGTGSFIYGKDE